MFEKRFIYRNVKPLGGEDVERLLNDGGEKEVGALESGVAKAVENYREGKFESGDQFVHDLARAGEVRLGQLGELKTKEEEALRAVSGAGVDEVVKKYLQELADTHKDAVFKVGRLTPKRLAVNLIPEFVKKRVMPNVKTFASRNIDFKEYSRICDSVEQQTRKVERMKAEKEQRAEDLKKAIERREAAMEALDIGFFSGWNTTRRYRKLKKSLKGLKKRQRRLGKTAWYKKLFDRSSLRYHESVLSHNQQQKFEVESLIKEDTDPLMNKLETKHVVPLKEMSYNLDLFEMDLAEARAKLQTLEEEGGDNDDYKAELKRDIADLESVIKRFSRDIGKREKSMKKWMGRDNLVISRKALALRSVVDNRSEFGSVDWSSRVRGHKEIMHKEGLVGMIMRGMSGRGLGVMNYDKAEEIYEGIIQSAKVPDQWPLAFKEESNNRVLKFLFSGVYEGRKVIPGTRVIANEPENLVEILEKPMIMFILAALADKEKFERMVEAYIKQGAETRYDAEGLNGFLDYVANTTEVKGVARDLAFDRFHDFGMNGAEVRDYCLKNTDAVKDLPWTLTMNKPCSVAVKMMVDGVEGIQDAKWIDSPEEMVAMLQTPGLEDVLRDLADVGRFKSRWEEYLLNLDTNNVTARSMPDFVNYLAGVAVIPVAGENINRVQPVGNAEEVKDRTPAQLLKDFLSRYGEAAALNHNKVCQHLEEKSEAAGIDLSWKNLQSDALDFFYKRKGGKFNDIGDDLDVVCEGFGFKSERDYLDILNKGNEGVLNMLEAALQVKHHRESLLFYLEETAEIKYGGPIPAGDLMRVLSDYMNEAVDVVKARRHRQLLAKMSEKYLGKAMSKSELVQLYVDTLSEAGATELKFDILYSDLSLFFGKEVNEAGLKFDDVIETFNGNAKDLAILLDKDYWDTLIKIVGSKSDVDMDDLHAFLAAEASGAKIVPGRLMTLLKEYIKNKEDAAAYPDVVDRMAGDDLDPIQVEKLTEYLRDDLKFPLADLKEYEAVIMAAFNAKFGDDGKEQLDISSHDHWKLIMDVKKLKTYKGACAGKPRHVVEIWRHGYGEQKTAEDFVKYVMEDVDTVVKRIEAGCAVLKDLGEACGKVVRGMKILPRNYRALFEVIGEEGLDDKFISDHKDALVFVLTAKKKYGRGGIHADSKDVWKQILAGGGAKLTAFEAVYNEDKTRGKSELAAVIGRIGERDTEKFLEAVLKIKETELEAEEKVGSEFEPAVGEVLKLLPGSPTLKGRKLEAVARAVQGECSADELLANKDLIAFILKGRFGRGNTSKVNIANPRVWRMAAGAIGEPGLKSVYQRFGGLGNASAALEEFSTKHLSKYHSWEGYMSYITSVHAVKALGEIVDGRDNSKLLIRGLISGILKRSGKQAFSDHEMDEFVTALGSAGIDTKDVWANKYAVAWLFETSKVADIRDIAWWEDIMVDNLEEVRDLTQAIEEARNEGQKTSIEMTFKGIISGFKDVDEFSDFVEGGPADVLRDIIALNMILGEVFKLHPDEIEKKSGAIALGLKNGLDEEAYGRMAVRKMKEFGPAISLLFEHNYVNSDSSVVVTGLNPNEITDWMGVFYDGNLAAMEELNKLARARINPFQDFIEEYDEDGENVLVYLKWLKDNNKLKIKN